MTDSMMVKPILAVAVLVTGGLIYGVVPAVLPSPPGGQALSPFSDGYDNLTDFKAMVGGLTNDPSLGAGGGSFKVATLVGSPTVLLGVSDPSKVVYFAAGVSRDYRAEEVNALVDFVKRGGKVVVADDFGYANTLAQKFGIFYFGTALWDLEEGHYDRNISLPLITFTFAGQDYTIEMNAPTGITLIQNPEVNTTVIAHCSDKCYADIDRSGTVNIGDKKGNITVIIKAQLQNNVTVGGVSTYVPTLGEAYFISDSSLFTNQMLKLPAGDQNGTLAFAKSFILTLLPQGGTVLIDESRHLHAPGAQVVYSSFEASAVATSRAELAAALIGGAAILLALVVLRAKDRENWIHRFDLSTFHPREQLPETLAVQVQRLRNVARLKVQMTHSMSDDEFAAVPQEQLGTMIHDPLLADLVLNPGRAWTPEELRPAAEHIKNWGK